jgi:RHS repeat-associated protein
MQVSRGSAHVLVPATVAFLAVVATAIRVSAPPPPPPVLQPGDTAVIHGPRRYDAVIGSTNTIQTFVDSIPLVVQAYHRFVIRVKNGNPDGTERVQRATVGSDSVTGTMGQVIREIAVQPTTLITVKIRGQASAGHLTVELLEIYGGNYTVFHEVFSRTNSNSDVVFTRTFNHNGVDGPPFFLWIVNGTNTGTSRLSNVTVRLNNDTVVGAPPRPNLTTGTFTLMVQVSLPTGSNTLVVTLPKKQAGFIDLLISSTDVSAPTLKVLAPIPNLYTRLDSVAVLGTMTDPNPARVSVNGVVRTVVADTFRFNYALPQVDGNHVLTFTAVDAAGNRVDSTRTVHVDRTPPTLSVTTPQNGFITNHTTIGVNATIADASPTVSLYMNGVFLLRCAPSQCSMFTVFPPIAEGPNTLVFMAKDSAGNTSTTQVVMGTRDTQRPTLTVTAPADSSTVSTPTVTVTGTASDAMLKDVKVNGVAVTLNNGAFSKSVDLVVGQNTIAVVATDSATNADTVRRTVTRSNLPPDPATVATAIDPTVATTVSASTAFLYSGANPIQTGVAPGTINTLRAAVVRGRVLGRDGTPMPGVAVTVLGHPELGQTLSRADGRFDLVVNGGGQVTLDYSKAGLLSVQRNLDVPWQDFVSVDDAVMVPLDAQVSRIDFTAPVQVARGSVSTDASGTRRGTFFFKQGTHATAVMPDGSQQSLPVINVRVTEYTVGTNGPQAMPAPLPPASAYTYAAEFSADEAAGAKELRFDQAVPFYLENFLNFPVGLAVPMAFYDRTKAAWMPSRNGRVVKVVSETGGLADLDITGDGIADDASSLGVDNAERQQLATLYDPPQTLWRVPVTHFSPSDANFPDALPTGAKLASGLGGGAPKEPEVPCPEYGSIIECENQTLGERVNVVGTGFTLNYRSDRVPGRIASRRLVIPLVGDTVPEGLSAIVLEIHVAGQVFEDTFPAEPNQKTSYTWDGRDAYGRIVQGLQPVTVRIGYVYPGVYRFPAAGDTSFGLPGGDRLTVTSRVVNTLNNIDRTTLGNWDARAQGLAGWTLDVHHAYDPIGGVIYMGDGTRRGALTLGQTIRAFAGSGLQGFLGDGLAAVDAKLNGPNGIAVASDGTVYIADTFNGRVRRVTPAGIISTVAGTGEFASGPDGGLASQTALNGPGGVAVAADGTLYIAEFFGHKVRRVGSDGIITTVAGNGVGTYGGDGAAATTASLRNPLGIAFGPDGSLFIADNGNQRVRRVGVDGVIWTVAGTGIGRFDLDDTLAVAASLFDPEGVAVSPQGVLYIAELSSHRIRSVSRAGIIRTVAGTGSSGFVGDGGAAVAARLNSPSAVAIGRDGSLYIADCNNARIRRVGTDGVITTFGGVGQFAASGNGGPPTSAGMDACYVATGPDGTVFVAEPSNNRARAIRPTLPNLGTGDILIASSRGDEIYRFDAAGKHLTTFDPLTHTAKLTFAYTSAGLLSSITDAYGNVTTVDRDANGQLLSITGPFSRRTLIGRDAAGNVSAITNPASESFNLTYFSGGLLETFADPKGQTSRFEFDSLGRLTRDEDANGGVTTLVRKDTTGGGFSVTMRRDTLPIATFSVAPLLTGGQQRKKEYATGGVATNQRSDGGATVAVAADGTTSASSETRDPRFSATQTLDTTRVSTPGGVVVRSRAKRTVDLSTPSDPFSVVRVLDTVITNDRVYLSTYVAADRSYTRESPEHRQRIEHLDSFGQVVSDAMPGITPLQDQFDALGRLSQTTQGTRQWLYTYDATGRLASKRDPMDRTTQYFADLADRVTRRVRPDGQEILFGYDLNGNLTSVTPPGRPAHHFTHNSVNVLASYDPPALDGGNWSTTYTTDANKNVTRIVRPDGLELNIAYDTAGRMLSTTLPNGVVSYTYEMATGNPVSITGAYGTNLALTYDGSLVRHVSWSGAVSGTVDATYDVNLRPQSLQLNSGTPVTFAYDGDGLLIRAGDLTITRDATSGFVSQTTLGQLSTTRGYSSFGQLSSFVSRFGGNDLLQRTYTRDAVDRVTDITETVGGVTTTKTFGYDLAGRLTTVTEGGITTAVYEYDANGNRNRITTPSGVVSGSFDAQDRLSSLGTTSYTYTRNGELATKTFNSTSTSFVYDVLGNLIQVGLPNGASIQYLVDGLNRRVGKKVNGVLVKAWLYQGELTPIAELDGSGQLVSQFVYGTRANVPDYMVRNGRTYQYITDDLGSVRLIVDASTGEIVQRMSYDPWGVVSENSNPGFQPFGFGGGLYDEQTGLVRFGARDYDAQAGRWTAKDPAGIIASEFNAFAYVGNDPINSIDPTGEQDVAAGAAAAEWLTVGWEGALVEPTPVGEIVMTVVTVGVLIASLVTDIVLIEEASRPRGGRWQCRARCHGTVIIQGTCCPPFLEGFGSGPSYQIACMNAKYAASQSAPRGCYGRHCRCYSCTKA